MTCAVQRRGIRTSTAPRNRLLNSARAKEKREGFEKGLFGLVTPLVPEWVLRNGAWNVHVGGYGRHPRRSRYVRVLQACRRPCAPLWQKEEEKKLVEEKVVVLEKALDTRSDKMVVLVTASCQPREVGNKREIGKMGEDVDAGNSD